MAKKPKVSVLMPFYDSGNARLMGFFAEAVDGILSQTFRDFELLIAVSGKKEFAASIARKSKKIRLECLKQGEGGCRMGAKDRARVIARARNFCLRQARSEIVAWADADDVSLRTRLEKQCRYLAGHPEIGAVGTPLEIIDAEGKPAGYSHALESDREIRGAMLRFPAIHLQTAMLRKSVAMRAGGYRGSELSEDFGLLARMAKFTKFHNLQEPLVRYRVHGGNASAAYRFGLFLSAMRIRWWMIRELGLKIGWRDAFSLALSFAYAVSPDFLARSLAPRAKKLAARILPEHARK